MTESFFSMRLGSLAYLRGIGHFNQNLCVECHGKTHNIHFFPKVISKALLCVRGLFISLIGNPSSEEMRAVRLVEASKRRGIQEIFEQFPQSKEGHR